MNEKTTDENEMDVEQWLAIRKEAGLKIDPETAEVIWNYTQTLDPYGVCPDLPEEYQQIGREYFARSPGGEIWVWFGDLPNTTRDALWKRHSASWRFQVDWRISRRNRPTMSSNPDDGREPALQRRFGAHAKVPSSRMPIF